jgi:hypothetical protein
MKTATTAAKPQILVFGLDQTGKPQAGRFVPDQAEPAKRAAASLKLSSCEVSADLAEIAKEVPVGRVHARGRAFIPYVKRDLYDRLNGAVGSAAPPATPQSGAAPPLEQSLRAAKAALASALPQSWDVIEPGHLVLLQESVANGWYEAIVVKRENETLTLRFRDYPKYPTYTCHIRSVGLVHPGLN